jgi:D-amino-acid dehydrogenase
MVGLSTAWFLQQHGVHVTVVDRDDVAAGSSWGNAGWLSPGLATPLPEPRVLRYGLQSLFDPGAALYVPLKIDPQLWGFLIHFASKCTMKQWKRSMAGYLEVNLLALQVFDELSEGGVVQLTTEAPIVAAFERASQSKDFRHEFTLLEEAGQHVKVSELSREDTREVVPNIASGMELVLQVHGQRYVDPGAYVHALADSFIERGGVFRKDFVVRDVKPDLSGVTLEASDDDERCDAVVLATGALLNQLASGFGVRTRVQAGRGYSFSLATDAPVPAPIYFPATRVACTPYQGGLRVGGTMEFRSAEAPLSSRRVSALIKAAKPTLAGVDWDSISDTWVGSRPVTADGLPLVGATASSRVYVAGGHGMWGITLGPVTGKLLAEQIITGTSPAPLRAFDPLR